MFKTNATFSRNLDRATRVELLSPDWDAILAICDTLRQGDCSPKPAVEAIKKKLQDKNPHIGLQALQVLDAVVKNCGKPVHDEVITMSFMEELKDMAKRGPEEVRNRVLEVIQCWAHGFRDKPQYRIARDTVNLMKLEGYKFPVMREADALFVAESAPDWVEGECCHRCRGDFSLTNRRHHCRNCGQIFCNKCSSKVSALAHFGIEKEVRVCDACYESINAPKSSKAKKDAADSDLPAEYLASALYKEPQAPPKKTKEEIQEEEEFQLALAISQSEAEAAKKKHQQQQHTKSVWRAPVQQEPQQKLSEIREDSAPPPQSNGDLDKYLNRKYWEDKQQMNVDRIVAIPAPSEPSAPTPSATPSLFGAPTSSSGKSEEVYQNGESEEVLNFVSLVKSEINVFTNRLRSNMNRRRPLAADPTMVVLFNKLLPMRQQLLERIQQQEGKIAEFEHISRMLIDVRNSREELDGLREKQREKKRMEAEERDRLMRMKLDDLRIKKREYLEYQHQIAYQQLQAQEQELQRRRQMTSYQQPYGFVPAAVNVNQPPMPNYPGQPPVPGQMQPVYNGPPPNYFTPVAQPPSGFHPVNPGQPAPAHYYPQPQHTPAGHYQTPSANQEYGPPAVNQYTNVTMPGYPPYAAPPAITSQAVYNQPVFQPIPQQGQPQPGYYPQAPVQSQLGTPVGVGGGHDGSMTPRGGGANVTEEQPLISFD